MPGPSYDSGPAVRRRGIPGAANRGLRHAAWHICINIGPGAGPARRGGATPRPSPPSSAAFRPKRLPPLIELSNSIHTCRPGPPLHASATSWLRPSPAPSQPPAARPPRQSLAPRLQSPRRPNHAPPPTRPAAQPPTPPLHRQQRSSAPPAPAARHRPISTVTNTPPPRRPAAVTDIRPAAAPHSAENRPPRALPAPASRSRPRAPAAALPSR